MICPQVTQMDTDSVGRNYNSVLCFFVAVW